MITKISLIIPPNSNSYFANPVNREKSLNESCSDIKSSIEYYNKIHEICEYINNFPDCNVSEVINKITGREPSIKSHTKRKRTYSFGYLYIHEEDQES